MCAPKHTCVEVRRELPESTPSMVWILGLSSAHQAACKAPDLLSCLAGPRNFRQTPQEQGTKFSVVVGVLRQALNKPVVGQGLVEVRHDLELLTLLLSLLEGLGLQACLPHSSIRGTQELNPGPLAN